MCPGGGIFCVEPLIVLASQDKSITPAGAKHCGGEKTKIVVTTVRLLF